MKKIVITILSIALCALLVTCILISFGKKNIDESHTDYGISYSLPEEVEKGIIPDVGTNDLSISDDETNINNEVKEGFNKYNLPISQFDLTPGIAPFPYVEHSFGDLDDAKGIDLRSVYDENSLTIERVELNKERYDDYGYLPQVRGLINKEVEERINNRIKELYNYIDLNTDITYIYVTVNGSFSNILSFTFSVYNNLSFDDPNYINDMYYLNFDLRDGSEISFNELFTSEEAKIRVLRNALYEEYSLEGFYLEESDIDYYGYNENALYKSLKLLLESDKVEFSISPQTITIKFKNFASRSEGIDSYMYSYLADDPLAYAIYDRFLTEESLFEDNTMDVSKEIFVCSKRPTHMPYYFLYDNVFLDFYVYEKDGSDYDYLPKAYEAREKCKEILYKESYPLQDKIQRAIMDAEKNPDKMYVILGKVDGQSITYYTASDIEETNSFAVFKSLNIYTMDKKYFDEVFFDKLTKKYRTSYLDVEHNCFVESITSFDSGDVTPINDDANVTLDSIHIYEVVNFVTGDIYQTPEELMADEDTLYEISANVLSYYFLFENYTQDELIDYAKNHCKYFLTGYEVRIMAEDNPSEWIAFSYYGLEPSQTHLCDK